MLRKFSRLLDLKLSYQVCSNQPSHTPFLQFPAVLSSIVLQPSPTQFVQQFGLSGCCLLRSPLQSTNLSQFDWLGCCCESSKLCSDQQFVQHIETTLASRTIAVAQPYEVVLLSADSEASFRWLYGCFWHSGPERYYLFGWRSTALTDHQQYGMRLYAQALTTHLASTSIETVDLREVLQRNRHQLRTPLALMLLYVDLLKTIAVDSRSQEWIQNLRTTVEEMHISLNHLTEITVRTEKIDYFDLRSLIAQTVQGMQPWIQQKQLTVVYDPQPLWVRVDEWKIKQVFQNLLSNAIAFAPTGGQITWEWQIFQTEVLIKISDNGPGLSVEDLRSLGTPFYSRRPGGTGLGLSIAHKIVLEHHGSLWGDNLPDGGAQFCITLPKSP